ncbi:hypothetical protein [Ruegeria sp. HKCCD8929]|uniref:hypothetical protein n=1 Tax=Ruegeria sp. HKCCD8929 TaxID=2683006 RepID=UPI001487EFD1|nr:hypothetical protein [Ruegeria sp. HKCCD8929]
MTIKIEVSLEFQATAARLLREAGFALDRIVGNEVFLTEGVAAEAYAALADLQAEAARDELAQAKADALGVARQIAVDVRQQIAGAATVHRALAWAVKMPYAMVWAAHEAEGDPDGPFAPFAAVAEAGFRIEADVTGETAVAIRDRAIEKNRMFFQATQLVEGMERLAEDRIPAAADAAGLQAAIAELQTLEAAAMDQLATITTS